jgi:hypothetical protein
MRRKPLLAIAGFLIPFLSLSFAQAQSARTWVSGVGDDASLTCSRTAPCKTFAGAISKTSAGGEINCTDPGGFGVVTIAKSLTIDCHEVYASVQAAGSAGITINAAGINVTLRNLNINGNGSGTRGINILAAGQVHIEDVMISLFTQQAIADVRSAGAGTVLSVKNSIIRNNTGAGIAVAGVGGGSAIIDGLHSVSNGYGVAVANANRAIITRSALIANLTAGVQGDAGSQLSVENSVLMDNGIGVQSSGTSLLANSNINYNGTGISGATTSFGNNRIFGNNSLGTTPTLGAASSDHSQQ